jgi:hypothetical protein
LSNNWREQVYYNKSGRQNTKQSKTQNKAKHKTKQKTNKNVKKNQNIRKQKGKKINKKKGKKVEKKEKITYTGHKKWRQNKILSKKQDPWMMVSTCNLLTAKCE